MQRYLATTIDLSPNGNKLYLVKPYCNTPVIEANLVPLGHLLVKLPSAFLVVRKKPNDELTSSAESLSELPM